MFVYLLPDILCFSIGQAKALFSYKSNFCCFLSRSLGEPNIATEVLRRKVIKEQPPADFRSNC